MFCFASASLCKNSGVFEGTFSASLHPLSFLLPLRLSSTKASLATCIIEDVGEIGSDFTKCNTRSISFCCSRLAAIGGNKTSFTK